MKIYFARHGQKDWNTLGKVQGTTDIPLNENQDNKIISGLSVYVNNELYRNINEYDNYGL